MGTIIAARLPVYTKRKHKALFKRYPSTLFVIVQIVIDISKM